MANSLDVKSRDIRDELDADDPLLELTRIMGLAPHREEVSEFSDPQISIEDDFSFDLEQELQLAQNSDVELNASDFSSENDFSPSFEDELSHTLQFGSETPSVVPSLEDELEALLAGTANEISANPVSFDIVPTLDAAQSFHVEPTAEIVEDVLPELELEPEPWLDADFEPYMEGAEIAPVVEEAQERAVEDPILSQMNRVFGRSNLTASAAQDPKAELAVNDIDNSFYASEIEFDADDQPMQSLEDDFDFQFEDRDVLGTVEASNTVELDWHEPASVASPVRGYDEPLERLVSKTVLEPVVEATEFEGDAITAMDELDIPDFDLAPETASRGTDTYDLDDDYQGYEPPVARVNVEQVKPEIDDFAIDMLNEDDGSEIDFESMLNDELTASVDETDNRFGYAATAAATVTAAVAGRAAYRAPTSDNYDEMPDVGFLADEIDASVQPRGRATQKSTWLIAAAVGAIALMGAGYYAFSGPSSGTTGNAPVLVKADPDPVKVAPETPGGKTVANQDQAVYDKVGGEGADLPSQGQLVSESEEPVDIASVTANDPVDPNAKAEDRVDPALETVEASGQAADTMGVSPKKVRTVIVKPDGTLVERPAEPTLAVPAAAVTPVASPIVAVPEPAAPAVAAPATETPDPKVEVAAVAPEVASTSEAPATEVLAKVADAVVEAPKAAPAIKVVKTKKIKAPAPETAKATVDENAGAAPVLESRPADQPVNIVGKTGKSKPAAETQVAAADTVVEAPAVGGYSVQIASTPSPEAAKSTYAALSRKFGGVLGGRGVNVQKADVAGKGTVYRVRIPAGSKQEAAALCQQYKSAGGNCFITK